MQLRSMVARLNPQVPAIATAGSNIEVGSKKQVMDVFMDQDRNYSVAGYGLRATQSFGQIYLCLDDGASYVSQSTAANAAIRGLSSQASFDLALNATRKALASLPTPGKFELADLFGIGDKLGISDRVLASICEDWFDLPDGSAMVAGALRLDATPPARCPGHYALPSGYIFKPDPDPDTIQQGQEQGRLLKQAADQFVTRWRGAGRPPAGPISGALFAAFPNRRDDDLLARTLIGVMIGFLPTVQLNLVNVVRSWWEPEFRQLQDQLRRAPGPDLYTRAVAVLERPMKQRIQEAPVPGAVWRTAVKPHMLDGRQVNVGDYIWINIETATQEDLQNGITDVLAVFGGDRSRAPHPTHACPGYNAAMGVLLGIIAGLME